MNLERESHLIRSYVTSLMMYTITSSVSILFFPYFSYAFDRVPQTRLLFKLHRFVLTRIFLYGYVMLNHRAVQGYRAFTSVASDVPGWSLLGLLLFLIFMNLLAAIYTNIRLFADGCVLCYKVILSRMTSDEAIITEETKRLLGRTCAQKEKGNKIITERRGRRKRRSSRIER